MSKRPYLIAAVIFIGVAVALFLLRVGTEDSRSAGPGGTTGLTSAEIAAGREAANRIARMTPAPVRSGAGAFSAAAIQAAEAKFRRMVAVRGLITQDKERGTLARQILATPDGADLMRAILLDPALARQAFGEFQAEARFYAITVLDEAARQGKLDYVVEVAAELGKQLAEVGGEIDRGRAEDLRGVASVLGRTLGSRGLQDPQSTVLARLGFGAELARPVHQLYVEGLFYGVWKAESVEQAMAAVKTL